MDYPVEILPNTGKSLIKDFSNSYLIRHTDSVDIWDDDIDLIRESAICTPRTNMPDLSSSLLGVFVEHHSKLKIMNDSFNEYCSPDFQSEVPVYNKDFCFVESRGYWLLKIDQINNLRVNYNFENNSYEAICVVNHTPMIWNFFHLSINWFLLREDKYWHDLDPIEIKKKWSRDRLSSITRSALRSQVEKLRIEDV
jgi:hypothetical protein